MDCFMDIGRIVGNLPVTKSRNMRSSTVTMLGSESRR